MFLVGYECITAAGFGYENLMRSLYSKVDHSIAITANEWRRPISIGGRACLIEEQGRQSYLNRYNTYLDSAWKSLWKRVSYTSKDLLSNSKTLIILSSTKGFIEDYIWDSDINKIRNEQNPYQKILDHFTTLHKDSFSSFDSLVISNACASSHVALQVAQNMLDFAAYESVVIIATDLIGPFIYSGFQSLKVLSTTKNKPFAKDRDGLQLGEALAILLLQKNCSADVSITNVASDTEGGSVTKPSMNGTSLLRTLKKVIRHKNDCPDFVIAHGTGTIFNDLSESIALIALSKDFDVNFPVTGIKWCVGHTLGASGALDVIAASEVLKNGTLFSLANSHNIDDKVSLNIISSEQKQRQLLSARSAVVTSLGFGGVHAALRMEKKL